MKPRHGTNFNALLFDAMFTALILGVALGGLIEAHVHLYFVDASLVVAIVWRFGLAAEAFYRAGLED